MKCRSFSAFQRGNWIFFQRKLHERIKLLHCSSGCSFLYKEIEQNGKFEFEMKIPYKANVNPQVSIQISAGSSIDCRNTFKWKKVGAFNVYGEKWEISVLCKIQRGWIVAKRTTRSLRPGVHFIRCYLLSPRSHRESSLYTLSRIILRIVGTSLLRFILRKSLVHAWRKRTDYLYLFSAGMQKTLSKVTRIV